MDIFDLENYILKMGGIIDDIQVLQSENAEKDAYLALAVVYNHHFNRLWNAYEEALANKGGLNGQATKN